MTCHCDFREDCCCQEEVRMPYRYCCKVLCIAGGCLLIGIAAIVAAHRLMKR